MSFVKQVGGYPGLGGEALRPRFVVVSSYLDAGLTKTEMSLAWLLGLHVCTFLVTRRVII